MLVEISKKLQVFSCIPICYRNHNYIADYKPTLCLLQNCMILRYTPI